MASPPALVPVVAGDPIVYSDTADLQAAANRLIPLVLDGDVATTTGGSMVDLTGLEFACTSGKRYNFRFHLFYTVGGTSTGISVGFNHPGGSARSYTEYHGVTSAAAHTDEWQSSTDTDTGPTGANASGTEYMIEVCGYYACTSDGTFILRFQRNGTSTTVTILDGSGGLVVASA